MSTDSLRTQLEAIYELERAPDVDAALDRVQSAARKRVAGRRAVLGAAALATVLLVTSIAAMRTGTEVRTTPAGPSGRDMLPAIGAFEFTTEMSSPDDPTRKEGYTFTRENTAVGDTVRSTSIVRDQPGGSLTQWTVHATTPQGVVQVSKGVETEAGPRNCTWDPPRLEVPKGISSTAPTWTATSSCTSTFAGTQTDTVTVTRRVTREMRWRLGEHEWSAFEIAFTSSGSTTKENGQTASAWTSTGTELFVPALGMTVETSGENEFRAPDGRVTRAQGSSKLTRIVDP